MNLKLKLLFQTRGRRHLNGPGNTVLKCIEITDLNMKYFSDMERCDDKSCHCVGPFYSFGNYEFWNELQMNGK